jgi:putative colanic acid biosynthesis UDP-glucose lipid carrier transferase
VALLATHDSSRARAATLRTVSTPPGPTALLRSAIDPVVAVATLGAACVAFGGRFDGACLILSLLIFAMTFPGNLVRRGTAEGSLALALDIVTAWIPVVALLALLGWASRTLGAFDPRMLAAWALATPAALFVAHRMMPPLFSRLLAAEGMRKTAVIAGANDLGRRLAAKLREDPLLGVRFTGYFDDRGDGRLQDVPAEENLGALASRADNPPSHPGDEI